jgi:hypothetical protein
VCEHRPRAVALGEAMSLALARRSKHIKGLALPKFVERGNFRRNKLVTRALSVEIDHPAGQDNLKCQPTKVQGAVNDLDDRDTLSSSLHPTR